MAPFHVGLVNLRQGDGACDKVANTIFSKVASIGSDITQGTIKEQPKAGGVFALTIPGINGIDFPFYG